jgi:hypothetical protein
MFKKLMKIVAVVGCVAFVSACAPEVGSKDWCDDLEEKPKGDWSSNEAVDYTKHCLITSRDDE